MREIKINITKARIVSFVVTLDKDIPKVTATIELLTDGGKSITAYSIASDHWDKNMKFDLPIDMIFPIKEIAHTLEWIVADHCKYSTIQLEAPPASGATAEEVF